MRRVAVVIALLCGALVAPATAGAARARLVAFSSCRALVSYAQHNAARAGGIGVPVRALGEAPVALERPQAKTLPGVAVPQESASADAGAGGSDTFSTTNVQEAGIDEPDVVKTDGRMMYVLDNGVLRVVDVTGAAPREAGALAIPGGGQQLLLRGSRVLVLATSYSGGGPIEPLAKRAIVAPGGGAQTVLTEVDVSDPAAPRVARTMTLAGSFADARMNGGTARVVVASEPLLGAQPLAHARLRTFVPATTIASRITGRTYRRGVVGCGAIRRPDVFSGLGLVTVLTVDLDRGLYDVDRDAVMAGAQTVYGSPTSLYVASQRYVPGLRDAGDVPGAMKTEIHRFDASQPGQTTYAGSGTVPGFVVNAYALSEQDGALRVASTDEPSWLPEGGGDPAQSYVTVLKPGEGGALQQVGQVGGLGRGQRIYGVRFLGTAGYVVTFRQMDPLYTLDLSDAANPRVLGELELPGYSAYLQPIAPGLLLGVGTAADAQGRPQGTQLSVFDVSDPAHPKRVQHAELPEADGMAAVENDPHAFLWWAPTQTAFLPLESAGAVAFHAAGDALTQTGRIDSGDAPVARTLVVGDKVYTLAYDGLRTNNLSDLAATGFLPFPATAR
ncbi:beta-propeller domain-containing protein [Conexibacter woesei]|uniref:beta-propeller domain-containing protein n=1 Tax=Conexibacter woesei TaxID=191495 RepID=UPI000418C21C|nr:beta-propeller domain-containing protein [Conexibacter woesei]